MTMAAAIRLESIRGLGANLCGKLLGELGASYLGAQRRGLLQLQLGEARLAGEELRALQRAGAAHPGEQPGGPAPSAGRVPRGAAGRPR